MTYDWASSSCIQLQLRIALTVPNFFLISECNEIEYCPISMSAGLAPHSLGMCKRNREVLAGGLLLPPFLTFLILESWRITQVLDDIAICCSPGLNSSPYNAHILLKGYQE